MVELLKWGEEKLPVRISYYALKMTKKELGKDGDNLDMQELMSGDIELLEPLLYYSLQSGHRVTGEKMNIKREDVVWVLDEVWQDFLALFPSFFRNVPNPNKLEKTKKTPTQKKG